MAREPLIPAVDLVRARRALGENARTIPPRAFTKEEMSFALALEHPDARRPRSYARDCIGDGANAARPCPWVGCEYHIYLSVDDAGSIQLNFPDQDPWELTESCLLDIVDSEGMTLEQVGERFGLTRERVRQIEMKAALRLRVALGEV